MDKASDEIAQAAIDRFWETIPPTWNLIRGNIRAIAAADFDITVEQFHILRHIRKGMDSVSDLAEAKQISRSAISQAVEVLVSKGLITRCEKPGDRRYVHLELTPAGSDLLNAIFQKNKAWMMERMAGLSAEEIENILIALKSLKKAFVEPAV